MNEAVTRADIHIGILRALIDRDSTHLTTKRLAQFIINNHNTNNEVSMLGSLMYICQTIFEEDLATMLKMVQVVVTNLEKE